MTPEVNSPTARWPGFTGRLRLLTFFAACLSAFCTSLMSRILTGVPGVGHRLMRAGRHPRAAAEHARDREAPADPQAVAADGAVAVARAGGDVPAPHGDPRGEPAPVGGDGAQPDPAGERAVFAPGAGESLRGEAEQAEGRRGGEGARLGGPAAGRGAGVAGAAGVAGGLQREAASGGASRPVRARAA